MQPVAIFGDIHANLPALEAVLADMDRRGLMTRYCLGDLVGYGTFPNEVIGMIRARSIPTLMGNYDQGIGNDSEECGCANRDAQAKALGKRSIAWTLEHTAPEHKAYLRQLPSHYRLQLGALRLMLVHGSPRKVNEYLYEDRPERSLERLLDLAEADVLVCGHTHIPYHRVLPGGRQVVNAGSVGKPKDADPRACYAIVDISAGKLAVTHIRVVYDIERAARAIEVSPMPAEYAQMLRHGSG